MGWRFLVTLAIVLLGNVISAEVLADTFFSTGRSAINGDLNTARTEAINNAVRNATLQHGGYVQATTHVQNGNVVDDRVRLAVLGQVKGVEVIEESHDNGIFEVKIKAQIVNQNGCSSSLAGTLSKSVLLTAFPRLRPETSRVGRLYNIDSEFAGVVSQRLYPAFGASVQVNGDLAVISGTRYLPADELISDRVQRIAEKFKSQFVVSGTIDDMSMIHPDEYFNQSALGNIVSTTKSVVGDWFGSTHDDMRTRNFALRVVLFDGISGQIIFDKTYKTEGVWDAEYTEITTFGTPRFWATDYGRSVSGLIDKVVSELGHKIRCQPFMANAAVLDEQVVHAGTGRHQTVHIDAGANQGLKVGNIFSVYSKRKVSFLPSNQSASAGYVSLNMNKLESESEITIVQVYPTYSIAKASSQLHSDVDYLAILF